MLHFVRGTALLLVVVLASCRGALTQTTTPTSSAAAETPAATRLMTPEPDPITSQNPTLAPTTSPTVQSPPTISPERTFDPNAVWHQGQGIPPGAILTAIAIRDPDFVVAGFVDASTAQCPDRRDARIWGSSDGADWYEVPLDHAQNARIDVMAASAYGLPAIGHRGSYGCADGSIAVWHPTDKSDWFSMDSTGVPFGEPSAALGVGDHFIVSGLWDEAGQGGVWLLRTNFYEGAVFERAAHLPERLQNGGLVSLAAIGETVVGWFRSSTLPAWYSPDEGLSWENARFQPPYWFLSTDATGTEEAFYTTGRACCVTPGERAGEVFTSANGREWTSSTNGSGFARPVETIVEIPGGLVALGEQTYVSADGIDWRLGPSLAGYDPDEEFDFDGATSPYRLKADVFGTKIVVVTPEGTVWFASTTDLDAELWPDAAPAAELPRVGDSFATQLSTHCGPNNGPLYFGLRKWVADLPDDEFPRSFSDPFERGTLTLVARDRLEFLGEHGDVVVFRPTDTPPPSFPCA